LTSIKHKEKPCKPTGKARASDYGCGEPTLVRTYGLCSKCYSLWLLNTPEGKEKLSKALKTHKGSTKRNLQKQYEKDRKKHKIENMTAQGYRSEKIQKYINEIARIIDNEQPCISSGNAKGKMNGGHYHSVGSNETLALNLHNIHIQSEYSNNHKGGDHVKYLSGLIKIYGIDYGMYVQQFLNQCPPLKLSKADLVELRPKIIQIRNRLRNLNKVYTPNQRIELRNSLNKEIGIYKDKFAKWMIV